MQVEVHDMTLENDYIQTVTSDSCSLCQGALDLTYLANRCSHGKKAVADVQAKSHRYVGVSHLADVHADMLKFQSDSGGNPTSLLAFLYSWIPSVFPFK